MTPIEILTKTRELLADPVKWTKGHYARTSEGLDTHPGDPLASCFCILGALSHISKSDGHNHYMARKRAKDRIRAVLPQNHIAGFNDDPDTTHQDVLNVLDKAIEHVPV